MSLNEQIPGKVTSSNQKIRREISARFDDNIWVAELAETRLLSKGQKC